jgi:hypothetical protein
MFLLLFMILLLPPRSFSWSQLFPNLHSQEWIREKLLWKGKFLSSLSLRPSFQSEESLSHAITVASQGTSDLTAHIGKFKGRKSGRLLKLPCVTNVELAVISALSVLHLSHPGSIDLHPEIILQGISSCRNLFKQKRLGFPKSCIWKNRRLQNAKSIMKEILLSVLSCKLKKEGQDKDEDTHSPRGSRPT